jgi:hypothetical protein
MTKGCHAPLRKSLSCANSKWTISLIWSKTVEFFNSLLGVRGASVTCR